jgi:hypothetical protein
MIELRGNHAVRTPRRFDEADALINSSQSTYGYRQFPPDPENSQMLHDENRLLAEMRIGGDAIIQKRIVEDLCI